MTTFWPPRESSREGRRRLSWGSAEVHTGQWHASDGTPIEVPEPRTVIFSGSEAMNRKVETYVQNLIRAALAIA
jgi:hypothetical protein